jgi:hypothetical protein
VTTARLDHGAQSAKAGKQVTAKHARVLLLGDAAFTLGTLDGRDENTDDPFHATGNQPPDYRVAPRKRHRNIDDKAAAGILL